MSEVNNKPVQKIATREAYGKALAEFGAQYPDLVVLDADLANATKTNTFQKAFPERHIDCGIAECDMMGIAAGLSTVGKIPFASSFAMFAAGRAYEQVRNSIGYPHLNVKIGATHAGITVGEDGASHQSVEDIGLMRSIPGMHVFQPCDATETIAMIKAVADIDGPCYVRLGRSGVDDVFDDSYVFEPGKGIVLRKGSKIAVVATGMMVQEALKAAAMCECDPTVVNIHTIKPIDETLLIELARTHDVILTCEEHSVINGLGSAVCEVLAPYCLCKVERLGIRDVFGESGKPKDLLRKYGLDAEAICAKLNELCRD